MLLDDGELAKLAPASNGIDASIPFETAARVALADLEHLTALVERGRDVTPGRWDCLAADLSTLHDVAVLAAREPSLRSG